MSNPIELVYNKLFELAIEHPTLAAVLKAGNRKTFTADTKQSLPQKPFVQTGDLPELLLSYDGITNVRIQGTSTGTYLRPRFSFLISTGTFKLDQHMLPMSWAILETLTRAHTELLSLTYNSVPFVKRLDVFDVVSGVSDANLNRNVAGWTSIWRAEVEIHVKTSVLKSNATP